MNQNICISSQARPLPGLVKFYLFQLYPLAVAMLLCRVAFGFAGLEEIEGVAWSLVCLAFGVTMLAAIAGLHTRAAWAPQLNADLNKGLALLCLGASIRIIVIISKMRLNRYGFGGTEMYIIFAPAFFTMNIPVLLAWSRYFTNSQKLAAAFGCPARGIARLPEVAVAFMRVICASYIVFFATFIAFIFAMAGARSLEGNAAAFITACMLPYIVFPALLLFFTGARRNSWKGMFITLGVFIVCARVWTRAQYLLVPHFAGESDIGELYAMLSGISTMPVPSLVLFFILGIIAWKIWTDPAERSWFANGSGGVRMPEAFTLYGIVLLYYVTEIFITSAQSIIANIGNADRPMEWRGVIILVLSLAAMATSYAHFYKKRPALVAFCGAGLLAVAGLGTLAFDIFAGDKKYSFMSFMYTLPFYGVPLITGIFALCHWRKQNSGIFKLDTPYIIFILTCVAMMFTGVSQQITQIIFSLMSEADNFYWRRDLEMTPGLFFLGLEYWAAYLVCPLLAIKWLRDGLKERSKFYVLGVVWIFSVLFSVISKIANLIVSGTIDFGMNISRILDPTNQVYIYAIVFIMIYLGVADKNMQAEKPEDASEGVAN